MDLGVDYIFANLGTDHVSLIEEIARWDSEGRSIRKSFCVRMRSLPCMAGGYALATGKGQAVFVHVDAGTANACMAIQNLFRYRLPVMLFAGRAPYTLHGELPGSRDTYVHFVQDPFDIASIVRPYVKWEYSLPSGVVVKEALARASAFMHSDPPGPVYMMLPRETLAEHWDEAVMPAYHADRYGSVRLGGVDPARIDAIADQLMAANNPIALTAYLGRKPEAVAVLDRLARTCGIRVAEFNSIDLNISQDSPCFAGFDPLPLLEQADLGLLLDSDVPFVPQYAKKVDAIKWIQIDIDPLEVGFPDVGISDRYCAFRAIAQPCCSKCSMSSRHVPMMPIAAGSPRGSQAGTLRAKLLPNAVRRPPPIPARRERSVRATSSRSSTQSWRRMTSSLTKRSGTRHCCRTRFIGRNLTAMSVLPAAGWFQRRHGARVEARAAASPRGAGHRRWRVPLLLAGFGLCRRAAVSNSHSDGGAGQWRLAGSEVSGATGSIPRAWLRRPIRFSPG